MDKNLPSKRKKDLPFLEMMMLFLARWGRRFFWLVIISFVLFLGHKYFMADPQGYCAKQKRYLTDEDYLQIVVGGLMKSGLMKLEPSDTTAHAYLENHPGCCRVDRGDDPVIDRGWLIFHGVEIEVAVTYEMSEEGRRHQQGVTAETYYKNGGKETYYTDIRGMDICGKYVGSTGMTVTPPDRAKPISIK